MKWDCQACRTRFGRCSLSSKPKVSARFAEKTSMRFLFRVLFAQPWTHSFDHSAGLEGGIGRHDGVQADKQRWQIRARREERLFSEIAEVRRTGYSSRMDRRCLLTRK